jgi:uncharacterized metal-binding protein YceD (DUF177 family)
MTSDPMPFSRVYNLGRLGRAGDRVTLSARGDELRRIAAWAEVRAVESFSAEIELQKLSTTRFSYDVTLRAEIVQDCVVTLEPVRSTIERVLHRELHLAENRHPSVNGDVVVVDPASDEAAAFEEIASLHYTLARPVLEELILAIHLYPRAPGVAFAAPEEHDAKPESPFAVLKNLKKP